MGYKGVAIKGISWIAALRGSTRLISFLRTAILARLLTPLEFGIFGIASLFLTLLEILTETGINVFLVQEKKDIKEYINSAWIVSILRGFVLFFLILLLSPLIVGFFESPQSLLIIQMIAVVPLIRGFINPAIIIYQKELRFGNEFWLRFTLFMVNSIVAITAAFIFRNAASFVLALIADVILEVILSFVLIKLRPKFDIELPKIKKIFSRGKWVTLSGIFSYFAQEGDSIAVGKLLGTSSLGFYNVAYRLSSLPISEVTDVISKVVFPVYSKISTDRDRLFRAFLKTQLINFSIVILLSTFLFIFAEQIVLLLLGDNWSVIIPVFRILTLYGALRAVFGSASSLFLSVGKQEYVAGMTFVRMIALGLVIIPFVLQFGLIGAGYAALISVILEIPIIIFYTTRVFKK